MMVIKSAKFLKSAPSIAEALEEGISEVAFLGRSNVGKSSFINSITNIRGLAKSSSTPGKTKLINFFEIVYKSGDDDYLARFVDLPGFGYAKVSKAEKKDWEKNLTTFIESRDSIRVFVFLRDARHPNNPMDKDVKNYLESILRPDQKIVEIYTKADKLNQSEKSKLLKANPNALFVSNLKKTKIQYANQKIFDALYKI